MNVQQLIELINDLVTQSHESEWFELSKTSILPKRLVSGCRR
jgi:hypothetical protein